MVESGCDGEGDDSEREKNPEQPRQNTLHCCRLNFKERVACCYRLISCIVEELCFIIFLTECSRSSVAGDKMLTVDVLQTTDTFMIVGVIGNIQY